MLSIPEVNGLNYQNFASNFPENKFYRCDICNKEFKTIQAVKVHRNIVHGVKKHENFVHEEKKHGTFSSAHKFQKPKIFQCKLCEKSYTAEIFLKNHVSFVHEKVKHMQCEYCGKAFMKKGSLERHMAIVHNMEVTLVHVNDLPRSV